MAKTTANFFTSGETQKPKTNTSRKNMGSGGGRMTSASANRGGPSQTSNNYYSNDFFKAYGGVTQSEGKFAFNESKFYIF
jgi:hypothetical protein